MFLSGGPNLVCMSREANTKPTILVDRFQSSEPWIPFQFLGSARGERPAPSGDRPRSAPEGAPAADRAPGLHRRRRPALAAVAGRVPARRSQVSILRSHLGMGNQTTTTGFGHCFHLPGCHLGYLFWTHSHFSHFSLLFVYFQRGRVLSTCMWFGTIRAALVRVSHMRAMRFCHWHIFGFPDTPDCRPQKMFCQTCCSHTDVFVMCNVGFITPNSPTQGRQVWTNPIFVLLP